MTKVTAEYPKFCYPALSATRAREGLLSRGLIAVDIDAKRLSNALSSIYGATLDHNSRACLPDRLAAAFDATSCLLQTRAEQPPCVTILGATANLRALMPAYAKYLYARDLWAERATRHVGRAMLGEEIVPERELVGADWYNDLCKPHGVHYIVGSLFSVDDKVQGQIGVHRPPDASHFGDPDRAMLDLLIPHLRQAYRLMHILDANVRASALSFEVLAALAVGVIVIAPGSRVRLINAAAERIVQSTSAIAVRNNRLSLADPKLDDQLRRAAWKASLAPIGQSLSAGTTIVLRTRQDETLPLMIVPLPPDSSLHGAAEPLAAILIGEPNSQNELSPGLAREFFGLTPAETKVMIALVKGRSLAEYADNTGLSINTVHSQAKSLFAKTGSHRQTDLVAKILGSPMLRIARKAIA